MTSLAIGQISLDVRTLNECFSVHYLCKLETKHPKHGLIIVYCLPSSTILKQSSQIIISHHIKSLTAIKVNATFVGRDPATIYVGASIKDVGIFLAVFDTPLPRIGILTLIYPTSTF